MSKLTKKQQKDKARKAYETIERPAHEAYDVIEESATRAYRAIVDPAHRAYEAKLEEIDAHPDEIITFKGKRYQLMEDK